MTKMLADGSVYRRSHPSHLRRFELQDALTYNATHLLPGLLVTKSNLVKYFNNQEVPIDIIALDPQGEKWWVGIIVTSIKNFDLDVLVPIFAMRRLTYLVSEASDIATSLSVDDDESIKDIILNTTPDVVAFVSNPNPQWFEQMHNQEGILAVLEVFSEEADTRILRLNGNIPAAQGSYFSACAPLPELPHVWRLEGTADRWPSHNVVVEWEGDRIEPTFTPSGNDMLLKLPSTCHLPFGTAYSLWRITTDHFILRSEDSI
ncbi:hypothetical protein [Candidatus Poriferisocius sp.]|uniref:hypothetical protein n=1 Tax=Candidatus Poriferisocius sp. TaxID=3101276 RepID=UPI003B027C20